MKATTIATWHVSLTHSMHAHVWSAQSEVFCPSESHTHSLHLLQGGCPNESSYAVTGVQGTEVSTLEPRLRRQHHVSNLQKLTEDTFT